MSYSDITYDAVDGTARITINRPDRLNAIRIQTYEELADALALAATDESVRVVVLTGAGTDAFTTGGDVEMAHAELTTHAGAREHMMRIQRVSDPIVRMDKPVIAAVNGVASGSGAEIIMFCDLVIAADNASFGFSGTDIGGCLGWGTPQLLPLLVGLRRAEEILLLSRRVAADEAERIGLVTRTVDRALLAEEVDALCKTFVNMPRAGLRATKAGLRATKQVMLASLESTLELCAHTIAGPDAQQAFAAMLSGDLGHEKVMWRTG